MGVKRRNPDFSALGSFEDDERSCRRQRAFACELGRVGGR